MQLATVELEGEEHVALIESDRAHLLPRQFGDMVSLIEAASRQSLDPEKMKSAARAISVAAVRWLPPIRRFRRDVLCTGWNYWDHFDEGIGKREGQDVERPAAPTFFNKSPAAMIGAHDPIAFDLRISEKWDYEGEIVIIVGRQGRSIPSTEAHKYIFGYTLANDVSQRDLQRRHGGQWFKGKSIDGTAPLGPFITTADVVDLPNTRIETFVNGEKRQDAYARQMAFPIGQLIAELSFGMTLYPGDVILTGTPSGIGMARNPPLYLADGDEIVVRAAGLGELRNRVTATDLSERSDVVPQRV